MEDKDVKRFSGLFKQELPSFDNRLIPNNSLITRREHFIPYY